MRKNVRTAEPSQFALELAFNRTKLGQRGYTLQTAMANPALQKSLRRAAQTIDKPRPPDAKMRAANDA